MAFEKLGTLAEKLEFANALLKQKSAEISTLRVQNGKDASFIVELQAQIDKLQVEATAARLRIHDLENNLKDANARKRPTPEEKAQQQLENCREDLRRCRDSRNALIAQLNRGN